ncbi:tripartite tricarboxylate transporter substrate binding protein [Aquincola tertiaricarbonis]|uniref:Tripartite tricarboxylate transporter substrate binding protein n=1 Tax=Aquincola tertiaricarbonis TaxID=391953 RepID=A0ABY4S5X5_AQUTE|nr:tripartite tricarboxylate transporter substrate binding protein [Aquincola tertiaricarbonis]URI08095.1 tripartite tricarboxylate transporter substrate binding protein [Aquincola tertiaricarbonis]
MTTMNRRTFHALAATALLAGTTRIASAQGPGARPMTLVVPYPAGGLSDAIARVVERPLAKAVGQMVIIENIGGVGGAIAAQKVLGGALDGGAIYQGSPNELILTPMALQAARYRAEDWRLVQMIGSFPLAVLARKGLPANDIDELVALARKAHAAGKPLSYASVGVGSLYHLLGAHFANSIGVQMTHVPYKGAAPAMQDLAGDQVDVAFIVVGESGIAMAQQERLKVLATLAPAGKVEAAFLRGYPSINESKSVHDFAFNTWTGYFVPKSTPEPVARALNQSLSVAIGDPEVKAQIEKLGGTVPPMMTLEAAAKEYESQTARFRAIAKSVKLEPL